MAQIFPQFNSNCRGSIAIVSALLSRDFDPVCHPSELCPRISAGLSTVPIVKDGLEKKGAFELQNNRAINLLGTQVPQSGQRIPRVKQSTCQPQQC